MKNEQTILTGILFFIFFLSAEADVCNQTTLIYGKAYFQGYYNDSQVINATVEVWNKQPDFPHASMLSHTNTDITGEYSINISKNITSVNQTFYVMARWSDNANSVEWDYKNISISCGNLTKVDFEVTKSCLFITQIKGAIKKIQNGEVIDAPGEATSVILNFYPKGSGNFFVTIKSETSSMGNTTYNVLLNSYLFYIRNNWLRNNWPTDLLVSMEPFNNHYYRYYIPYPNNTFVKYWSTSIACGDQFSDKNFYIFNRKNVSDNCSYNDECLSDNCYKKICVTSCIRGDVNGDASADIFDVVEILQYLAYGTNIKEECMDMNEDDSVTILDALAIIVTL